MKKRVLMMLLAIVMVVGLMPVISTPACASAPMAGGGRCYFSGEIVALDDINEDDVLQVGTIVKKVAYDGGVQSISGGISYNKVEFGVDNQLTIPELFEESDGEGTIVTDTGFWVVSGLDLPGSGKFLMLEENVTPQFTITFNTNGGSAVGDITQDYNSTVTVPADPAKTGFVFMGWNTEADGSGTTYDAEDTFTLTRNMTLYAQWKHQHPICGASCTHNGEHTDVEWTEIVAGTNLIRRDAYSYCYELAPQKTHYYLSGNLSLPTPAGYNINYPLRITQDTYLCLGGYSLSGGVVVENGATLYLCDCKGTGKISNGNGRGVEVKSGRFVMYSGSIANCSSPFNTHGAGVYVGSGGSFDMYGGTIENCSAYNDNRDNYASCGGGVYVTGTGVFNMYNGLIDSCKANKGGGVAAANGGTFNMNGGTIQDCNIGGYNNNRGGGVYIAEDGNFTMSGTAAITGCSASMGGGVYADSTTGSFTLAGGSITGCASSGHTYYGAVYLNSANMTVSGEVTIQGTGDGDLTICKGHNTNGVITFTENGKLAENIRIYIEPVWGNKWSTKEDTRFISAASDAQRNTLKSQITLRVDNGGVKTGKIYDYDETDLRFAESYLIYVSRNNTSWGTVTLAQGNESSITSGDCFETITVTAQPAAGYEVDVIKVYKTGDKSSTVEVTDNKFTMPAHDVTVSVTFKSAAYNVSLYDTDGETTGGKYSVDKTTVTSGNTVTITPEPIDERYEVDAITVYKTGDENTTVTVTDNQFTMPAYDVTVSVTFREIHEHKLCQTDGCTDGHDAVRFVPVANEDDLQYYATNGGSVYLANAIELSSTITVSGDLTLCLNGNKITPAQSYIGKAIYVEGSFNLTDCGTTGAITGFTTTEYGGGVNNKGTFIMYNGTISNNKAGSYGGGVYNYGDAYIYGGTIENNESTENGGGLYHYYDADSLLLSGNPTISGNTVNDVDNNVYLDIALTIDENFAPTAPIGITTAEFGRFAIAADGANIPDISVYEEKFTSDGNFPIYARENALYLGYYITEEPGTANNYTVGVNSTDGVSYQWYKVDIQEAVVTDRNCSDASGWYDNYDAATGWTAVDDDYYEEICYFKVDMTPDDVLTVNCSGPVIGELMVMDVGSDRSYNMTREDDTYTFTATDSEAYLLYYVPAASEDAPTVKATLTRVDKEAVDGQTEAALQTGGLGTGTYACKVTWDMGTDGSSDDYSLTSASVNYVRPVSLYTVTVKNGEDSNGTVSVSKTRATSGSTIKITVTPDAYYSVEKVIVSGTNGKEVAVTKNDDGTYSFRMRSYKVTVEAVFVRENTFVDVSEDAFYYDAVQWAVANGITEGTSETTFSPLAACTRAQMVTFLWRAAGSPDPVSKTCIFADVPADAYYATAVQWAYEQGITSGTSATTYSPDEPCTRGQMATFLWHSAGSQAPVSNTKQFADVPAEQYYAVAVQWAYEQKITSGTGATTFSPDDPCTRAQMVTFLYRYYVK